MKTNRPFIHTLKTPYAFYIYDVNTDSGVKVSNNLYEYLNDLEHGIEENQSSEILSEIDDLKEKGYLKNFYPKGIKDPRLLQMDYLLNNRVAGLTLQITQKCNMRCSYCNFTSGDDVHHRAHSSKSMNYETAIKAIDFYYSHSRDSKRINVSFYGGEPLLEYEMIKNLILYVHNRFEGKEISFNMTTNAILLTPERLRFFTKNNMAIMVSLDGPKDVQNRSRKLSGNGDGSFKLVIRNLELLKRECPEEYSHLSFNSVIDPLYDMESLVEFYEKDIFCDSIKILNGDNNIKGDYSINTPIMEPPEGTRPVASEAFHLSERASEILALYSLIGNVDDKFMNPIALNMRESLIIDSKSLLPTNQLDEYCAKGGPCIPGVHNTFVRYDGKFFPCEKASDISDDLNIGSIEKGYDFEKIEQILDVGRLTEKQCVKCWAIRHCTSCAKHGDTSNKITKEMMLARCPTVKSQFNSTLQDLLALDELRPILLKYQVGGIVN